MTPSWAGGRPGPQLGPPPPSRASLPPQVGDLRVSFSYAGLSSDDPDLGPAHVVSGSPGGQGGASRVQTPGPRCVLRAYPSPSCVRTSTGPRRASGPGGSQRGAWRGSSSPVQALSLGADLCSVNAWSCAPDCHPRPAPAGSSPGLWREQPSGSASPRPTWRQGLGRPGAPCCLGAQ